MLTKVAHMLFWVAVALMRCRKDPSAGSVATTSDLLSEEFKTRFQSTLEEIEGELQELGASNSKDKKKGKK